MIISYHVCVCTWLHGSWGTYNYASECVRVNRQFYQALPLHHSLMVDPTPSSNTTFPSLTLIIACAYTHIHAQPATLLLCPEGERGKARLPWVFLESPVSRPVLMKCIEKWKREIFLQLDLEFFWKQGAG